MIDPRLTRWIHASVREFIETRKRAKLSTIHIYNEADVRESNKYRQHLELRIDGPYERHIGTIIDQEALVEINLLVNTGYNERDMFQHQDNMGLASYLLDTSIPILKIGDADDQQLIGYLSKTSDIITSNFGQIDPNVQIQQGSVEAHYTYEEC